MILDVEEPGIFACFAYLVSSFGCVGLICCIILEIDYRDLSGLLWMVYHVEFIINVRKLINKIS